MKICKKCLMPETYPSVKIWDDGVCNFCSDGKLFYFQKKSDLKSSALERKKAKEMFENFIKECKGKGEYDCLLLFSGGKDSTYLLYLLKEKYGLNVLAVTIDNGLEQPDTMESTKKITNILNTDHIIFKPELDFWKKIYRYFILNTNGDIYCDKVCSLCQKVIFSIGLNIAAKKKIPFIALGYSPDQSRFYETSKEELHQNWIPSELYNEPFNEKDRSYFWDPNNVDEKYIPRIIRPFYALDYPGIEKTIEILSELGLGSKRSFNPIRTNCSLWWLLMHLDIKKNGFNPYVVSICDMIRQGKDTRSKWFLYLTLGTWLLKIGVAKRGDINRSLNYLNLKITDII